MWKNKKVEKSAKHFTEWTLVLYKDDRIFAASKNKDIVELNMNLDVVKKFKGRDDQPFTINANENYLVVGYRYDVDVYSRQELDQSGTQRKVTVGNNFYYTTVNSF